MGWIWFKCFFKGLLGACSTVYPWLDVLEMWSRGSCPPVLPLAGSKTNPSLSCSLWILRCDHLSLHMLLLWPSAQLRWNRVTISSMPLNLITAIWIIPLFWCKVSYCGCFLRKQILWVPQHWNSFGANHFLLFPLHQETIASCLDYCKSSWGVITICSLV